MLPKWERVKGQIIILNNEEPSESQIMVRLKVSVGAEHEVKQHFVEN